MRGKAFVFTHNNYSAAHVDHYATFLADNDKFVYAVYGKERAPNTGTRHLQGYVVFRNRQRIRTVRVLFPGCHIECAEGTPEQCRTYCTKEGDFVEFGDFDAITFQGKRSEFDRYKEWLLGQEVWPSDAVIAANWTGLYIRYGNRLLELRELLYPKPVMETAAMRDGWQSELEQELDEPPTDDRKVIFYVDTEGGKGKTWFIRKYLSEHDNAQMFSIAKRDDLAHALDVTKSVFFINVPRNDMQYLQYGFLESLKDRMVFSPKYHSGCKVLVHKPHVVVFSNEMPDLNKLTEDRYDIREI